MMLQKVISPILFIFLINSVSAQFISINGTNASQFLEDNVYKADLSRAVGAEIYYSKPISFIPLPMNYNIGLDYKIGDAFQEIYLLTGLTYVTLTPSGFSAANAESVTYTTNKWLNYADINVFNGVVISDSVTAYKFGAELSYNVGYALTKSFFIHAGFGGRYNLVPGNEEILLQSSSVDLVLKAGVIWKFKRKFLH